MQTALRILLAFVILLLAACQSTVFESKPAGIYSTCDPAWTGTWRIKDMEEKEGPVWLKVAPECRSVFMYESDSDPEDLLKEEISLEFARLGSIHLLVISDKNKSESSKEKALDELEPGYILWRYKFKGNRLVLYPTDDDRIARKLLNGELPGHTTRTKKGGDGIQLHNFIAGNPEEIARLARKYQHTLWTHSMTLIREKDPPAHAPPAP